MKYLKLVTVAALSLILASPAMASAQKLKIENVTAPSTDLLVLVYLEGADEDNYSCDSNLVQKLYGESIKKCQAAYVTPASTASISLEDVQISSIEFIKKPNSLTPSTVQPNLVGQSCVEDLNTSLNKLKDASLSFTFNGKTWTCL